MMLMVIAVLFSCKSQQSIVNNKPAQQPSTINNMQAKIDSIKMQITLDSLRWVQEMQKIDHDKALDITRLRKISLPCTKEALELEKNNYMAAQGMATGKAREELALKDANRVAVAELMTRWLGVIKNGIEDYTKDSDTKSMNRLQQAQLEGLCLNVCEKSINKLMKVECREYVKDVKGGYGCYVALYVATNDVLDEIEKAIEEERELDVDKALFRKRMQTELDEQSRKKQEEAEAALKALEEKSE